MLILLRTGPANVRQNAAELLLRAARGRQFDDADVPERDFVSVVLQQNVPFELRAPPTLVLELALRLRRHQSGTLELVLDYLDAIEPMLDVHAVDENATGIDL